jgi:hypothetical protein
MLGTTASAVTIGTPITGLTPFTTEPKFAVGLPLVRLLIAVVTVMAPTQAGPATRSPIQATGRPFTRLVGIPGPVTTSPVAVAFTKVAVGVGINTSYKKIKLYLILIVEKQNNKAILKSLM